MSFCVVQVTGSVFIYRIALAKQGDNRIGSVRPSVCVSLGVFVRVVPFEPFHLDFWHGGRPWPRLGWDCRSRSNPKIRVFTSLLHCLKVKVQGRDQGQRSGSRSRVKVKGQCQVSGAQQSILGDRLCRVQQWATTTITSLRWLSVCL